MALPFLNINHTRSVRENEGFEFEAFQKDLGKDFTATPMADPATFFQPTPAYLYGDKVNLDHSVARWRAARGKLQVRPVRLGLGITIKTRTSAEVPKSILEM